MTKSWKNPSARLTVRPIGLLSLGSSSLRRAGYKKYRLVTEAVVRKQLARGSRSPLSRRIERLQF